MDVMGDRTTLFETGRIEQPSPREEPRDETAEAADEAAEELRRGSPPKPATSRR